MCWEYRQTVSYCVCVQPNLPSEAEGMAVQGKESSWDGGVGRQGKREQFLKLCPHFHCLAKIYELLSSDADGITGDLYNTLR